MMTKTLAKTLHSEIQKEPIVVTSIIYNKGKSARFRVEVKWALNINVYVYG